ncbi:MAG: DUF4388 domain-containing protein, partial [Alicyclobacillus sp.]|nr:DUF4388 domain-containing protein [Alicyclobacillus sp.]
MEVDLQGRLRAFSLSDILQLLSFSGQTGTLTLTQGWNSRSITFEKGRITYITAATKLATVGELLVKAGKITPQQLAQAHVEIGDVPSGISPGDFLKGFHRVAGFVQLARADVGPQQQLVRFGGKLPALNAFLRPLGLVGHRHRLDHRL